MYTSSLRHLASQNLPALVTTSTFTAWPTSTSQLAKRQARHHSGLLPPILTSCNAPNSPPSSPSSIASFGSSFADKFLRKSLMGQSSSCNTEPVRQIIQRITASRAHHAICKTNTHLLDVATLARANHSHSILHAILGVNAHHVPVAPCWQTEIAHRPVAPLPTRIMSPASLSGATIHSGLNLPAGGRATRPIKATAQMWPQFTGGAGRTRPPPCICAGRGRADARLAYGYRGGATRHPRCHFPT